jgi:hypothetical protein
MNRKELKKEVKTAAENAATQAATDAVVKVAADPNIIIRIFRRIARIFK